MEFLGINLRTEVPLKTLAFSQAILGFQTATQILRTATSRGIFGGPEQLGSLKG